MSKIDSLIELITTGQGTFPWGAFEWPNDVRVVRQPTSTGARLAFPGVKPRVTVKKGLKITLPINSVEIAKNGKGRIDLGHVPGVLEPEFDLRDLG